MHVRVQWLYTGPIVGASGAIGFASRGGGNSEFEQGPVLTTKKRRGNLRGNHSVRRCTRVYAGVRGCTRVYAGVRKGERGFTGCQLII